MTTSQPTHKAWDERLDEILLTFAKRIESIPRGKTYSWEEEKQAINAAIAEKLTARIKARDERVSRGVGNEQANKIFVLEIALLLETITGKPNPQ